MRCPSSVTFVDELGRFRTLMSFPLAFYEEQTNLLAGNMI